MKNTSLSQKLKKNNLWGNCLLGEICGHFYVSTAGSTKVVDEVFQFFGYEAPKYSYRTSMRATVATATGIDFFVSKLLSYSHDLWMGIDETSVGGRSFIEVEFGGCVNHGIETEIWCLPAQLLEVPHHTSEDLLKVLKDCLNSYNQKQQKLGIPQTKLYNFGTISFDTTAVNTGSKKGLGKILENERLKTYNEVC
jgi:hypothetical protein